VFELKHFDPSVNQNTRAPANYEAAHPKRRVLADYVAKGENHMHHSICHHTTVTKAVIVFDTTRGSIQMDLSVENEIAASWNNEAVEVMNPN
jgi:hypothetical protein